MAEKTGEAYAFFNCDASKKEIEAGLPEVRSKVKTPSKLELSLFEGMELLEGDLEIWNIGQEAKEAGIRYSMVARFPGQGNKKTADELSAIMNQAYYNFQIPNDGNLKIFWYRNGDGYVSRR